MKSHFIHRLMWGLLIILIGVALMMRQAGWISYSIGELISMFWPLVLVFLGASELLKRMFSRHGSFFGGSLLLIIGLVFLGRNTGFLAMSFSGLFRYIVPLVIIIVGLRLVFKPRHDNRSWDKDTNDNEWQAYTSERERPIPPAPPLHPDPTKPKSEWDEADDFSQSTAYQTKERGDAPQGYDDPMRGRHERMQDRMQQRAERFRERMERHADKWNSKAHDHKWWDPGCEKTQNRSSFIGDVHVGQDYFELQPMNISHFIGDTVLDLTKAQIQPGETRITISSFIGDVKVFVPNDYEVGIQVVSSAFIGDVQTLDRKEGGMFKHMNIETPYYHETDRKVKLVVSTFIGDVRVTKVG